MERQIHELSHWPSEPWCQACVAARGKADHHSRLAEGSLRAEAKSEYPVISMDFCFTRGLEESEEINREDIKLYGGDARSGVCLVVTEDWCNSVLCLPTPEKGRQHA